MSGAWRLDPVLPSSLSDVDDDCDVVNLPDAPAYGGSQQQIIRDLRILLQNLFTQQEHTIERLFRQHAPVVAAPAITAPHSDHLLCPPELDPQELPVTVGVESKRDYIAVQTVASVDTITEITPVHSNNGNARIGWNDSCQEVQEVAQTQSSVKVEIPKAQPRKQKTKPKLVFVDRIGSMFSNRKSNQSVKGQNSEEKGVRFAAASTDVSVITANSQVAGASSAKADFMSEKSVLPKNLRFSEQEHRRRQKTMAIASIDPTIFQDDDEDESILLSIVKSSAFDICFCVLLVANAVAIGLQCEDRSLKEHIFFEVLNIISCVLFATELVVRMVAHGLNAFLFTAQGLWWNYFDIAVVAMHIIETVTEAVAVNNAGSGDAATESQRALDRLVSIARAVRVLRVLRVLRFIRDLRVLVEMIYGTLQDCVWSLLLIFMLLYVCGIVFSQVVSDHIVDNPASEKVAALDTHYGSLTKSVTTLYKSIMGGLDWYEAYDPLSDMKLAGYLLQFLFLMYITFTNLAVMNVVAGLFLQGAIEQANQDQEHIISLRMQEKHVYVERLQELFNELDSSHQGAISLATFEYHLKDEHMQAFLQSFDIENADAWTLFNLLDSDGGGMVDINKFVEGCIRLKGNAKSIQIAQIMYHLKWIMDKFMDMDEFLQIQDQKFRKAGVYDKTLSDNTLKPPKAKNSN